MKTSMVKIFLRFKETNPKATIIFSDADYWLPTRKELDEFLKASFLNYKKFVQGVGECDKFALILHGQAVLLRWEAALNDVPVPGEGLAWAFGQISGTKFRGQNGRRHNINFCDTSDDGLLFIEPQTDEVWKPSSDDEFDVVIF